MFEKELYGMVFGYALCAVCLLMVGTVIEDFFFSMSNARSYVARYLQKHGGIYGRISLIIRFAYKLGFVFLISYPLVKIIFGV